MLPRKYRSQLDEALVYTAPRSRFDGFLPQGEKTTAEERRASYDKAVAESTARQEAKTAADRESPKGRYLECFKRVWSDGRETGTD